MKVNFRLEVYVQTIQHCVVQHASHFQREEVQQHIAATIQLIMPYSEIKPKKLTRLHGKYLKLLDDQVRIKKNKQPTIFFL
ncbi:hypothetical protein ACJX0J_009734, partial [Zea mays]